MKRRNFIGAFMALLGSPKIIGKLGLRSAKADQLPFGDLVLIQPDYYEKFIEKYGALDFETLQKEMGSVRDLPTYRVCSFEKSRLKEELSREPISATFKIVAHGKVS